jgi:hypothetical protein
VLGDNAGSGGGGNNGSADQVRLRLRSSSIVFSCTQLTTSVLNYVKFSRFSSLPPRTTDQDTTASFPINYLVIIPHSKPLYRVDLLTALFNKPYIYKRIPYSRDGLL